MSAERGSINPVKLPEEVLGYKVPPSAQEWIDRNAKIAEFGKQTQTGFKSIGDQLKQSTCAHHGQTLLRAFCYFTMAIDKRALRGWLASIREILNQDGDPISDCPEAEHNTYRHCTASSNKEALQNLMKFVFS